MTAQQAFDAYHEAIFRFAYRLTRVLISRKISHRIALWHSCEFPNAGTRRGTLKIYLFSIARNLVLKRHRDFRAEIQLDGEVDSRPSDLSANPELSSVVEQAVAMLTGLQREALVLFEYEGFTLEEIAEIVNADIGSVKSRLHRARARLSRI